MSDVHGTGGLAARGEQRHTGGAPLPDPLPAYAGRGQTASASRGLPHGRNSSSGGDRIHSPVRGDSPAPTRPRLSPKKEGTRKQEREIGSSTTRSRRSFDLTVGTAREAAFLARVHRIDAGPGPAAEAGALEVDDRLPDLLARAHHERAVVNHRLTDRLALQEQ